MTKTENMVSGGKNGPLGLKITKQSPGESLLQPREGGGGVTTAQSNYSNKQYLTEAVHSISPTHHIEYLLLVISPNNRTYHDQCPSFTVPFRPSQHTQSGKTLVDSRALLQRFANCSSGRGSLRSWGV